MFKNNFIEKQSYPKNPFIPTNPNSDNPRNWLTEAIGINFKQKLYYEKSVNGSTQMFNGTITAQQFGVNAEKEEKYYYDKLNRIISYTNTNNNTEKIEYADKLGNIKKITRTGESTATIAFAYNGNRISQANNKNYLYNVNGSVLNNGEINISNYNELNLPNRISKANTTMYFTYTADGKKIFKNIDNKEVRFYDDGIEFIKARLDSPKVKLEIINTDDGKIQVKGTKYYYQYFLKDHLGNVRAIVSDSNRAVIQRADYYAFGKVRLVGDTAIKYLYNGNEYQAGLDVYDFNARTYDPVSGRFLQVDPMAHKMPFSSPYTFCFNNPLNLIDIDGRIPYPITIRAFAPFKTFGGGFHGDNRGYSTANVSARLHQKIYFDTDKTTLTTNAWSSPSYKTDNPSNSKTAIPFVNFTDYFTIKNNGDNKTFGFGTQLAASNPLVKGSPDIDIFSNFSITENKKLGTLNINGSIKGDNFPSTEAFMTDPSGNNVFIGVGQIAAGVDKDWGPLKELPFENTRPITSFNFTILTDKKGNFTGVTEGKTTYSIADWNKRFTSQPTQKKE